MKIIYTSLLVLLTINLLKAQESSNLTRSNLSDDKEVIIANFNYDILSTTVNTDKSNIALGPFKDKFIISSYKRYPHTPVAVNKYTQEEIPNILCAEVSYDLDLKYPSLFSRILKSEYNEGAITFNKENNIAYLTRKKDLKDDEFYLFKSELLDTIKGTWSEPVEVLLDNKSIAIRSPRLSKDNSHFYFASDLPGGYGGYDIYVADNINGTFKNIRNLGPEINTEYNEIAAIDEGDYLYYSSNIPGGFGGYDIYRVTNRNGKYKHRINLGNKINSSNDEINLIPVTKSEGYITTNKNDISIFDILRYKVLFNTVNVHTTFIDQYKNPIQNLPVEIISEDGDVLFEGFTNTNGTVSIATEPFNDLSYSFTSDTYVNETRLEFPVTDKKADQYFIIELSPFVPKNDTKLNDAKLTLAKFATDNTIFFDFDKYTIKVNDKKNIENVVSILNENPDLSVNIEAYADSRGSKAYNKKLTERRANTVYDLLIEYGIEKNRITKIAHGSEKASEICTECTTENHALNRKVYFDFK